MEDAESSSRDWGGGTGWEGSPVPHGGWSVVLIGTLAVDVDHMPGDSPFSVADARDQMSYKEKFYVG